MQMYFVNSRPTSHLLGPTETICFVIARLSILSDDSRGKRYWWRAHKTCCLFVVPVNRCFFFISSVKVKKPNSELDNNVVYSIKLPGDLKIRKKPGSI